MLKYTKKLWYFPTVECYVLVNSRDLPQDTEIRVTIVTESETEYYIKHDLFNKVQKQAKINNTLFRHIHVSNCKKEGNDQHSCQNSSYSLER